MFRMIFNIAKNELALLFYSPVAWMILVVFALQAGMNFSSTMERFNVMADMGINIGDVTYSIFSNPWRGLFTEMEAYLYFYIPLLTMSILSKEMSTGSIKLLYYSPISNVEIILGKFLAMMFYGLCMIAVLFLIALCGDWLVKDFDWELVLSGILGLYLLLCAYAAIGVFMSSLTSYQIVAAVGTLAVLVVLGMVGSWWQEFDFIRDITYWLAISGRSSKFIGGLICSEDLLYFILVFCFFLSLTIIRLNAVRQKIRFSLTLGKYLGVILLFCFLGYITSLPQMKVYYDATATKSNTLTVQSQEIIGKLDGNVTITTYINALEPRASWYADAGFIKPDMERFEQYLRFKPDIRMKYVYYYDKTENPSLDKQYPDLDLEGRFKKVCKTNGWSKVRFLSPEEIRERIDLSGEGNIFVRQIVRENGEKAWLRIYDDTQRFPSEREISASFKRMVMELPKVGFVYGEGERSYEGGRDRDYHTFANDKKFRYALENQGFDVLKVKLDKMVPEDVNIIVISDMKQWFGAEEEKNLWQYIDRGGNLLVLGEPRRREVMKPLFAEFGFEMTPGELVKRDENLVPDVIISFPTEEAGKIAYDFAGMRAKNLVMSTPGVCGLVQLEDKGYEVTELFRTDSAGNVWNELQTTDFVDDSLCYNPETGERKGVYATVVALSRKVGDRVQKIVLTGDADCISNGEFGRRTKYRLRNYTFVSGSFFWLSDNQVPIDIRRPASPDNRVYISDGRNNFVYYFYSWILPLLIALTGIIIWMRRRSR